MTPEQRGRLEAVFEPQPLAAGSLVDYHGSLTAFHGRYILRACDCRPCQDLELSVRLLGGLMEPRYQLDPAPTHPWLAAIEHVRGGSITICGPTGTAQ